MVTRAPSPPPLRAILATMALVVALDPLAGGSRGQRGPAMPVTFFATSVGNGAAGGNYGGHAGADQRCEDLAQAASLPSGSWRAYLSTFAEDARDRIGDGPWHNSLGTLVAADVDALHANGIPADDVRDEFGNPIPGMVHDILTGSGADGRLDPLGANCGDFQANDASSYTAVGHSDGGGVGQEMQISWNAAHLTQCHEAGLMATAGEGRLYCFFAGTPTETPIFADGFESGSPIAWDDVVP